MTVSWSVNTLDEQFRCDMDRAVSIERRLKAMKQIYNAGDTHRVFYFTDFSGNYRCENYR